MHSDSITLLLEAASVSLDAAVISVLEEVRSAPVGIYTEGTAISGTRAVLRPNGIFVETEAQLPYGTRVEIVLATDAEENVCVPGVVRWCTDRGIGIHYATPRPRDLRAFHRYFGESTELH